MTFPYKRPWNTVRQSMPIKQGSHMITNGVVLGSTYNSMTDSKPFNCLRLEENRKVRGTGTFFPKSELNGCSCRERSPQGGERSRQRPITVRSRDILVSMAVVLPSQRRSHLRKWPVRFHVVGSLD
ncbi:uncharacterized protein LOC131324505 [Rhododendron vialii]|uniref:uncharacterized protein LOC131324505 n=1 Tax=Rhododendron vialii TaxID=182163 RepID=UPI00265F1B35|nr:uncharacterized protein LOC131324505 [Rhododendron vialii]